MLESADDGCRRMKRRRLLKALAFGVRHVGRVRQRHRGRCWPASAPRCPPPPPRLRRRGRCRSSAGRRRWAAPCRRWCTCPPATRRAAATPSSTSFTACPPSPSSYQQNAFVAAALASAGEKAIVVAPQGARDADSDREYLDWDAAEDWPQAISRDLPACIDARFHTIAGRYGRALVGLSAGGYGAMNIGLRNLDQFGAVQSWSGYFVATNPAGTKVLNLGSEQANAAARVPRGDAAQSPAPVTADADRLLRRTAGQPLSDHEPPVRRVAEPAPASATSSTPTRAATRSRCGARRRRRGSLGAQVPGRTTVAVGVHCRWGLSTPARPRPDASRPIAFGWGLIRGRPAPSWGSCAGAGADSS